MRLHPHGAGALPRTAAAARILLLAAVLSIAGAPWAHPQQKKSELTVALSGEPRSLDPQKSVETLTFQVLKSVYDTLVEPDERGIIVPALADSWSVSPDSLTWTFRLRRGVRFHNGQPLTSADVKATFDRFLSMAAETPRAPELAALESVVVVNPETVQFRLSRPSAPFLALLASGWSAILPAPLIASGHDFSTQPVGTGPFVFSSWQRGKEIVLTRNPDYWLYGLPRLDVVHVRFIQEDMAKLAALQNGSIQAVDALYGDALTAAQKVPSIKVQQKLSSMVMVLAFNCSRPPFTDARVRQAIALSLDKEAILQKAYSGGRVVGTLMDYGSPWYEDFTAVLPFDQDRARRLLAQAGYKSQRPLDLAVPGNYEPHVHAAEMIRDQLSRVGIDCRLRVLEWGDWLSSVYNGGQFDMTVIGQTGKLDPDGRLAGYGTEHAYTRWINDEVARTVDRARQTMDPVARKGLYKTILGTLAREVPQVYIGTTMDSLVTRSEVRDLRMTYALDSLDLRWTVVRP